MNILRMADLKPNDPVSLTVPEITDRDGNEFQPLKGAIEAAVTASPERQGLPTYDQLIVCIRQHMMKDAALREAMGDFIARLIFTRKIVAKASGSLDERQTLDFMYRLSEKAAQAAARGLLLWHAQVERTQAACDELLSRAPRRRRKKVAATPLDDDDHLCIACLDSPRSVVYKPCQHRVCCDECAEALWARTRLCPWCRVPCTQP